MILVLPLGNRRLMMLSITILHSDWVISIFVRHCLIILVEEGAHGTVDDTAVQDAPLGGLALTTVEGAGDAAHGIHSLLELDGQREVVDAGLGDGVAGAGNQNDGVAVTADTLGVGQLGNLTGFHGESTAADFHLVDVMVGILLASNQWYKPP